jgi:hypothetical protein
MVNFIKSKTDKDQKRIVLFQTGNYQYEIWNQSTKETIQTLWDSTCEDALAHFNEL